MKDEMKIPLGIAYLHSTIIIIFNVINYLMAYLFTGAYNIDKHYITSTSLIIVVFAAIWVIIYVLNKMLNQSFTTAFKDNTSRKASGTLLLLSCLISMTIFIPSQINSISQIIKNEIDLSVVPNIVSSAVFVCKFLIAIYFIKYKDKTGSTCNEDIIIAMPFLYFLIKSVFSLLSRFTAPIIFHSSLKLYFFLWLTSTIIVLCILYMLNRKKYKDISLIFKNDTVRKSAGLLLIIDSLIEIAEIFRSLFDSVWYVRFQGGLDRQAILCITIYVVRFIIFAGQMILGIYMQKYYKNKDPNESLAK